MIHKTVSQRISIDCLSHAREEHVLLSRPLPDDWRQTSIVAAKLPCKRSNYSVQRTNEIELTLQACRLIAAHESRVSGIQIEDVRRRCQLVRDGRAAKFIERVGTAYAGATVVRVQLHHQS